MVVDYYSELEAIHRARPELKGAPVIFTTLQFIPEELAMIERGEACFFDTQITRADAEYMTKCVHQSLWNWFLDKDNKDVSLVDGCSLGFVFAPALEYLFIAVLRYKTGLEKILKPEHRVFCISNTEETSLAALRHLQNSIGFELSIIEAELVGADRRPLLDPPFWRKDDLRDTFPQTTWKERLVAVYLRRFQGFKRNLSRKRVLISPGGKLDNYLDFIKKNQNTNGLEFFLPITKKDIWSLPFAFWKNIYYYYFYSGRRREDSRITPLVDELRRTLKERVSWIDADVLLPLMEQYVFAYFSSALAHYQTVCKWLVYLKPDLIFLSSDTPMQNLLGSAAKVNNITTVFCHHCLFMWGQAKTKSGPFKIVDYALAFGEKDRTDYRYMGLKDDHVLTAPLPYFSRFLNYPQKRNSRYKRAFILLHQYAHFSLGAKLDQVLHGFSDAIDVLEKLKIKIVGIKVGAVDLVKSLGFKDQFFEYRGHRIQIFSGYSSFPDVAQRADLIIGSVSTSIVEAGLLGIDYYLYTPPAPESVTPTLCPALESIIRIARTPEDLYQNICNRRSYHNGHSVADLVDLRGFSNEAELCRNFSAVLSQIAKQQRGIYS